MFEKREKFQTYFVQHSTLDNSYLENEIAIA